MKKAALCTLAYADVFDYPLTSEELYQFLIAEERISPSSFRQSFMRIIANEKRIDTKKKYFFLRDREEIVSIRKKREKWSKGKIAITQKVASWLRFIPTIKMVAVTGALAMKNSQKEDDIDILIVTAKNRLWLTRLITVLLIEVVAQRRRPGDKKFADKICLNMFLDENHLAIPVKERDLFSAHEVCQMEVLWEKEGVYRKFLKENQWAKRFLPNWKP